MTITDCRIKLAEPNSERLLAFATICIDYVFVIHDLKIIDGNDHTFIAMPSRKLTDKCHRCGTKNHLRADYCNRCGAKLDPRRAQSDEGKVKFHADICHPIANECRDVMQKAIVAEYQAERERSKQPGYVPSYMDYDVEG